MSKLRADLMLARGHWPMIAKDTDVSYFTIGRIARKETPNPQIDTFEKIRGWLDANQELLVPDEDEAA